MPAKKVKVRCAICGDRRESWRLCEVCAASFATAFMIATGGVALNVNTHPHALEFIHWTLKRLEFVGKLPPSPSLKEKKR